MANTYSQIFIHIVFAVKNRASIIKAEWENELYRYLSGAIKNHSHVLYAVNGTSDHVHLLVGLSPKESIADLVKSIKIQSSMFMKERFACEHFAWQSGYAAFSYSKSMLPIVENYIRNQKEHHKRVSLDDEMVDFLRKAGLEYDERFAIRGISEK